MILRGICCPPYMNFMTNNFDPNQLRGQPNNSGSWVANENGAPEVPLPTIPIVEERGEIDLDLVGSEAAAEEIAAGIAASGETFDLTYVEYDDKLTSEQINMLLSGQGIELESDVSEVFEDSRYGHALEEAVTACEARGVDFDELDPDDQDVVRHAIEEKDSSDPVSDLIRRTPSQLMRAHLGKSLDDEIRDRDLKDLVFYDDKNWKRQEDARADLLLDMLDKAGVNVQDASVREAVAGLVTEGPAVWHEGVTLDVIWYGDIADAAAPLDYEQNSAEAGRTLNFTDARVVLLDTINGSGMDAEISGPLNVTVTQAVPAQLDSGQPGYYGWDDTAGVVKSAYEPGNLESNLDARELADA